jgi:drug/metabolite transporter (DMT)-like permease
MRLDKGHFIALAAGVIWGTVGFSTRNLYDAGLSPLQVSTYRTTAMALVTAFIILIFNRKLFLIRKKDLPYIVVMGLFGTALGYLAYNSAMKYTTLAIASMLVYTNPIYTTILAAIFFKERIYKGKIIGLLLLISGCSMLVKVYDAAFFSLNTMGIIYGLLTGISISISSLCAKRVTRDYHTLTTVFYNFGVGALFLIAFSFPWKTPAVVFGSSEILSLAYLAIFPGVVAFFLYMYSIKRIEVSQTESCVAVEPVMAAILGFLFFGETLDWVQFLGAGVILLGVLVFNDAWGKEGRKDEQMPQSEGVLQQR